jgi:hypothetical protein
MSRRGAAWTCAAFLALGLVPARAGAQDPDGIEVKVTVDPGVIKLGERAILRGRVIAPTTSRVRWLPPEANEALTWGERKAGVSHGPSRTRPNPRAPTDPRGSLDTVWVELPIQPFVLGVLSIPGLRFEYQAFREHPARVHRLPVARLTVVSNLAPADSNADFRSLHGPIAAPWWERIPWTFVILGAALIALVVAAWWWRRRRRPAVVPAVAPRPVATRSPSAEALAALARLRAMSLPENGRFGEHAFQLGQILRRYLEATLGGARPGDTTPELVDHLREAGLEAADVQRLSGLLRTWDRVKFAREPMTVEEAGKTEEAVEAFVRRPDQRQVA